MTGQSQRMNLIFLLLAAVALLSGLWAGLVRLGWQWPALQPTLPLSHGPLMVSGFFGTLITLERAVALRKAWAYLGVLCSGLGGLLLLFGVPGPAGPILLTLGSLGMVAIFGYIVKQHAALHTITMALGALCWLVGNLFWLGGAPVYHIVLWWMAFLVLTIAGERLELSRVLKLSVRTQRLFLAAVLVLLAGLVLLPFDLQLGTRLAGLGLLALAGWLVTYDIARRTVRMSGLTRYIAVCLLSGYFWLAVSGLAALVFGAQIAGPRYDLILHGVFLGFVFSMVFGHAPIIFPAVLGLPLTYRPVFYAPLVLLHVSLALRLFSGLAGFGWGRLVGGLLNAIAILAFAGLVVSSARKKQA
jgi:hypothetical protein